VQVYWLPCIRAAVALSRNTTVKNAEQAIQTLAASAPYELGNPYVLYLRGQAYLATGNASASATEFQKIMNHLGGFSPFPFVSSLAQLGLARAYALGRDTIKSRTAYQDFFAIWKDADPEIPILKQAKAEYSKLI
jgi:predicted Zn-dependent protease